MQPNTGEACRTKTLRRLLFSCYYFRFNSGGKWLNASLSIFLLVLCHCCAAHCARLKRFIVFPRCSSSLLSEREEVARLVALNPFFGWERHHCTQNRSTCTRARTPSTHPHTPKTHTQAARYPQPVNHFMCLNGLEINNKTMSFTPQGTTCQV